MVASQPASGVPSETPLLPCLRDVDAASERLRRIAGRTEGAQIRQAEEKVARLLERVRLEGDAALLSLSETFDGVRPDPLRIPEARLRQAWEALPVPLRQSLELAHARILRFHEAQRPADLSLRGPHGETLGRRWRPVERAGLYVPGGRAAYPSTVLINAKIGRAHV